MYLPTEINTAAATRIINVCTFVLKGSVNFLYFCRLRDLKLYLVSDWKLANEYFYNEVFISGSYMTKIFRVWGLYLPFIF